MSRLWSKETYVTERGRKRRRVVAVHLAAVRAQLAVVGAADRGAWEQVRALLLQRVGESMFEIWLDGLELIAVEGNGSLVVSAPEATVSRVRSRFGRVPDGAAERVGRGLRIAEEVERKAAESLIPMTAVPPGAAPDVSSARAGPGGHASSDAADGPVDRSAGALDDRSGAFRVDQSPGRPAGARAYRSAYPSFYAVIEDAIASLGLYAVAWVPDRTAVEQADVARTPIAITAPDSAVTLAYRKLVEHLEARWVIARARLEGAACRSTTRSVQAPPSQASRTTNLTRRDPS